MKRTLFTAALAFACAAALAGQAGSVVPEPEEASGGDIFAPFPSRIRVAMKGLSVILSWEDSPDVDGDYAVYRHTKAIDSTTFPDARYLGAVPSGTMGYEDAPPDSREYYYLVLGRDKSGRVYEVFIPLMNATMSPVAAPVPDKPKAAVESISAARRNDSVVLSYVVSRPGERYVLYRHVEPILSVPKLLEATLVALFEDTSGGFVDYPVPGIPYFYALVEERSLSSGEIKLEAGVNATTEAVTIPAGVYRTGLPAMSEVSRDIPLPYLALSKSVGEDADPIAGAVNVPEPRKLSVETEKALKRALAGVAPAASTAPSLRVFSEDLSQATGAEDYTLGIIVRDKFRKGLYDETADQLARYLSIQRGPNAEARAHFYRGQALAMTGKLRDAFFEFLLAEDRYYVESNEWVNYILSTLRNG